MLGRRLTETEFSHAYGLLFQESGSVHECLSRVRSLDQRSLKQAYRRRAQETHPDRAHLRDIAVSDPEAEFRSVVAAYELLKLVQQGAVDVLLVTRTAASARPRPTPTQSTRAAGSHSDAHAKWSYESAEARRQTQARQARDRARQADQTNASQTGSNRARTDGSRPSAGWDRSFGEGAAQGFGARGKDGRAHTTGADSARGTQGASGWRQSDADKSTYRDRADQRAEAWGRFWQQTETTSKFNPWSDHYFEQQIPSRQLPFGQFLYYSGAISWRQLIDALVWQRQQRPMIGQLARKWGILTEDQVQSVLERRRQSGRYDVKFADFAEELGYLTPQDKMALCGRMKMLQKPIGQYFVDQGVFTQDQLTDLLGAHRRHNWRSMQRRSKPW